jgi:hypothetical protein
MLREARGHSLFNPFFTQALHAYRQGDLTSLPQRIHRAADNLRRYVNRQNVGFLRRPAYDALTSELGITLATNLFQAIGMLYLGDGKIKKRLGELAFNIALMSEDACCDPPEINGNPHRKQGDLPPVIHESVSAT